MGCGYNLLAFEANFNLGDNQIMEWGYSSRLHCICDCSSEGIISFVSEFHPIKTTLSPVLYICSGKVSSGCWSEDGQRLIVGIGSILLVIICIYLYFIYILCYYRPQTKFAKVMFLHVSVILSTWGGGWYPSMHCRWYPSMPCSRSPGGGIPACLAGFQTHTQGGSWDGSGQGRGSPGPQPRGKLWRIWGGLQAHIQRGSWGGSGQGGFPGPHPRGKLRGIWPRGVSRPTPRGVYPSMHWGRPPLNGYCCGRYASYWNAFLCYKIMWKKAIDQISHCDTCEMSSFTLKVNFNLLIPCLRCRFTSGMISTDPSASSQS